MSSSMKENKKSSKAQPLVLSYLPEDIITDILTRLPVKSLVRFRCVAKSWQSLISNPNFINTHLVKSSNFQQQNLILWRKDGPERDSYDLKSYSLDSLFYLPSGNANLSNGYSLKLDYKLNKIVGSCNGLVCVLMGIAALTIWNPSTRESKKLPVFDIGLFDYGFGYDKLTDDYKIVQMEFGVNVSKKVVKLYSLGTNSWKKIGDFPNAEAWPDNKFVNGALHWQVWESNRIHSSFVIVSLDLGNETYGKIAPPNYGGGICWPNLMVLEGCISLCYNFTDIRADIWVMKEHGVRDSWVKLYTIPYTNSMNFSRKHAYFDFVMLCNSVTGEILLKHDERLKIYHSKYRTFENKRTHDVFSPYRGATTYVESLVFPRGLQSKGKLN